MIPAPDLRDRWFPIAASRDLVPRHVYHGQLLKQELAVWRSDSGGVNVWENRCLHRGVRLSIGINLGRELKCQYHGWRYADGTAACTYIPAHPANAPPRIARNRTYPAREHGGLVWARLDGENDGFGAELAMLGAAGPVLRAVPVGASAALTVSMLRDLGLSTPGGDGALAAAPLGPFSLRFSPADGHERGALLVFVQPVDDGRSILRGVFEAAVPPGTVLLHYDRQLEILREDIERSAVGAAVVGAGAPAPPSEAPASPPLAVVPDADRRARCDVGPATPRPRSAAAMVPILYDDHLSAECYAVRLLLAFLEIEHRIMPVDVYPGFEQDGAAFRAVNPRGEVPTYVEDGLTLGSARSILIHLATRPGARSTWFPAGGPDKVASIEGWFQTSDQLTATAGVARLATSIFAEADLEACRAGAHRVLRDLDRHLFFAELEGQAWLVPGPDPTLAEIAMFPGVMLCEEGGVSRLDYPAVRRWTDRVKRIPGFVTMSGVFPAGPA